MLFRMATLENKKFNNKLLKAQHYILAGAPGFEPGNGGIKIRETTLIGLHISPDRYAGPIKQHQRVASGFPTAEPPSQLLVDDHRKGRTSNYVP